MRATLLRQGLWPELTLHFGIQPPDLGRYSPEEIRAYVQTAKALRKVR